MNSSFLRSAVAVVCLVLLVTGCSTEQPGKPQADGKAGNSASAPTSESGNAEQSALTSTDPCDLLTTAEIAQLGLTNPGEPNSVGTGSVCDWKVSGNGGLSVGVRPEKGVADLDTSGGTKSQVKVGKFDVTKIEAPAGGTPVCTMIIAVTPTSSVDVIANFTAASTDVAGACERATKATNLIAPKLP